MGFSASKASQSYLAATDQARVASGKGATITEAGSLALTGKDSKYLSPGAVEVTDKGQLNLGYQIGDTTGNVTVNDPKPYQEFAELFTGTLKDLTDKQAAALETISRPAPIVQVPGSNGTETATIQPLFSPWLIGAGVLALILFKK